MKTLRIFLTVISTFLIVGCTGPQGPAGPAGSNGSPGGTRVAIFSGSVASVPVSNVCTSCGAASGYTDFWVNVPQIKNNQNVSINAYYQISCSGGYFPLQGTSTTLEWYAIDFTNGAIDHYNMPNADCYLITVAY